MKAFFSLKRFLLLLVALVVPLFGSALIRLNQIQAPLTQGFITSNGAALTVSTVGSGLSLNGGVLSNTGSVPSVPAMVTVTASTPNAFPIPAGRSVCLVFLNGLQESNLDGYVVQGINIVFSQTPQPGDQVQLVCF